MAISTRNSAILQQNIDYNIGFQDKVTIFLAKIDHYIGFQDKRQYFWPKINQKIV
jgi:hypothetical protein